MTINTIIAQFFTIALVHFLAVASPGPDLAITLKQSISYDKQTGIYTSIGIGLGIMLHVFYSLLGLGLIISQSVIVYNIIKICGGIYLMYTGYKAITVTTTSIQDTYKAVGDKPTKIQAIRKGFLTNALNPKATLFFLSLFTAVINVNTPIYVQFIYGIYMAIATFTWFSLVSTFFGYEKIRHIFKLTGHWFERIMGTLIIYLGFKLIISTT